MKVKNEEELAKAINSDADEIEIEGDLAKKTIRIKATGRFAWIVAIGAITVAVVAIMSAPATAGSSSLISAFAAPAAVGILGIGTTVSAIAIAVAAGGVGVLKKLRDYDMDEISEKRVILRKK